ncbi:MAG TPA: hypothetical protein EYP73_03310 [Acidimicrobiia bacterium]|nr:hypothetical protein [Acidimicrobiia bacterium]
MSPRLLALALVLAACGGGAVTTTTTAVTTTQAAVEAPEAVLLSYDLEPGTSFQYEVSLSQNIVMSSEGDPSVTGDEEAPGEAELQMTATATFTYAVADGPEPGTYRITITGEFGDLEVSGTVDGEPVDPTDIPEFAALDPVETTVVVDEKGNVVPDDQDAAGVFGGDMDPLGGMATLGAGAESFFGPPLPDDEVTVGDTWTETVETPVPFGGDPVTTTIEGRVTGAEVVDGAEVFVIETTTSTTQIEFDLSEFFIGFFEAFLPEDATEEEKAEIAALTEAMKFLFTVDPSVATSTTWFDPITGVVYQGEVSSSIRLTMDVAMPDEVSGELVEFNMDMTLDQELGLRYLGGGAGA